MSYPTLGYLAVATYILPISAGLYTCRTLSRELKLLLSLLMIGCVTDIVSLWQYFGPHSARWLIHVYILVEFMLLMSIISSWQESRRMNQFFKILMIIYGAFWILAKSTFEPFTGLYYLSGSISGVLITLSAGYTLFVVIEQREHVLLRYDRFWVLLSLVINYTGSLLPIVFAGILYAYSQEYLYRMWSITWILAILSHVLYTMSFLCHKTRTT